VHGAFPKIDRWSSGSHIRERTLPDRRSHYKEKKLEPRLNEAKEGKRAVFFVDAAHFVMGAFLGFVWCFERLFVKSPSGFVKKKCLYGKYYENFSDFSSAIYECLNDAHLKHKKELDPLLTLRFQKFNKSQIMNV